MTVQTSIHHPGKTLWSCDECGDEDRHDPGPGGLLVDEGVTPDGWTTPVPRTGYHLHAFCPSHTSPPGVWVVWEDVTSYDQGSPLGVIPDMAAAAQYAEALAGVTSTRWGIQYLRVLGPPTVELTRPYRRMQATMTAMWAGYLTTDRNFDTRNTGTTYLTDTTSVDATVNGENWILDDSDQPTPLPEFTAKVTGGEGNYTLFVTVEVAGYDHDRVAKVFEERCAIILANPMLAILRAHQWSPTGVAMVEGGLPVGMDSSQSLRRVWQRPEQDAIRDYASTLSPLDLIVNDGFTTPIDEAATTI